MTGKLARRTADQVAPRRAAASSALAALDRHLRSCNYLANDDYSIADIAVFA